MPSSARSKLSQKLTSCDAVPDETSRVSLVTDWMALIHEFTCPCKVFKQVLSLRSFGGMKDILGCVPDARA